MVQAVSERCRNYLFVQAPYENVGLMHARFEKPFRIIEWSDNRCPTVSSTDNLVCLTVQQPLQSIIDYSSSSSSSNSSTPRRVCEKLNSISTQQSISTPCGHLQMLGCTRLCMWDCHQVCTLVDKQCTILLLLISSAPSYCC